MLRQNTNALGIIFPNSYDNTVPELVTERAMASIPFAGRYRMIDFLISNLSNSGVDRIQVYVKANPRSLIEHLGTGRHYNINSKRGKLHILTAEDMSANSAYNSDICTYMFNMQSIEEAPDPYVIITASNMIFRADYAELLDQHIKSGADISILYKNVDNAKESFINCDVLNLNRQKGVLSIDQNHGNYKNRAVSCGTYILSKELFISLVKKAANTSSMYWFKDIINDECPELDIRGISLRGFFACVSDFKSYYDANISLLDFDKAKDLFNSEWPIYTRTNDSCPTHYYDTAEIRNSVVSNGCQVEGTIENSILGRGCIIHKGAVIKNSVVLAGAEIGEGVHVENQVVDKLAKILHVKEVVSDPTLPGYIKRGDII